LNDARGARCCFVSLEPTPKVYRVPMVSPGVTALKLFSPTSVAACANAACRQEANNAFMVERSMRGIRRRGTRKRGARAQGWCRSHGAVSSLFSRHQRRERAHASLPPGPARATYSRISSTAILVLKPTLTVTLPVSMSGARLLQLREPARLQVQRHRQRQRQRQRQWQGAAAALRRRQRWQSGPAPLQGQQCAPVRAPSGPAGGVRAVLAPHQRQELPALLLLERGELLAHLAPQLLLVHGRRAQPGNAVPQRRELRLQLHAVFPHPRRPGSVVVGPTGSVLRDTVYRDKTVYRDQEFREKKGTLRHTSRNCRKELFTNFFHQRVPHGFGPPYRGKELVRGTKFVAVSPTPVFSTRPTSSFLRSDCRLHRNCRLHSAATSLADRDG